MTTTQSATPAQVDYATKLIEQHRAYIADTPRSTRVLTVDTVEITKQRKAILAEMGLTPQTANELLKAEIRAHLIEDALNASDALAATAPASLPAMSKADISALID